MNIAAICLEEGRAQVCGMERHAKYLHMAVTQDTNTWQLLFCLRCHHPQAQPCHFIISSTKKKDTRLLIARLSGDFLRCWTRLTGTNQKICFVTFATRIYSEGLEGGETGSPWRRGHLWSLPILLKKEGTKLSQPQVSNKRIHPVRTPHNYPDG